MDDEARAREIERIENLLFNGDNWVPVELTLEWKNRFEDVPGVYVLFDDKRQPVYVGETAGLRGRMNDMRFTVKHTIRRKIRRKIRELHFAGETNSDHARIEQRVNGRMQKLNVCTVPVDFGRKEVEEHIREKYHPIYND